MTKRPVPFFSGPFDPEEVHRLLDVIDTRVRAHADAAPGPVPPAASRSEEHDQQSALDPATTFEGESLAGLAAPRFHPGKGNPFVRAAKMLLNVPLGVLGQPQLHFNQALRRVIRSWADVLGATLDNLAALQREVAAQRARIAALEARLMELERDREDEPRA